MSSNWLTDDELTHLVACTEADQMLDCVLVNPYTLSELLAELRGRRAADLSDEEREALRELRLHTYSTEGFDAGHALAILSRLLESK